MASLLQASNQLDGLCYASRMCASMTSELLASTQAPGRRLQKTAPVGNSSYTQVSREERRRGNRRQRKSKSAGSKAKAQTQRTPSTTAGDATGTAIPMWDFSTTADAAVVLLVLVYYLNYQQREFQSLETEGCLLLLLH